MATTGHRSFEYESSLAHHEVRRIQRSRLLAAMVAVAGEVGYVGAAVAPVVARAGVSRRTFYDLFDSREECFLESFDWGAGQVREAIVRSAGTQRGWRERVRHGLAALLRCFDGWPELARVCVIESYAAGRMVLDRRAEIVGELAKALERGAPRPRGEAQRHLLAGEGIVGGAFSMIHGRLLEDDLAGRPLIDLHGELMALVTLPYLGAAAAAEELTREAPAAAVEEAGPHTSEPTPQRPDIRLTYRTIRCLMFIAEHPDSSNRAIARGSEITDEGQASKLLGRLARLNLVSNDLPRGPGSPNRWTLTPRGHNVLAAVRVR